MQVIRTKPENLTNHMSAKRIRAIGLHRRSADCVLYAVNLNHEVHVFDFKVFDLRKLVNCA